MKRFICRIFFYFTSVAVVIVVILWLNGIIINTTALKISGGTEILILGDSNTECALDDAVISNAVNLSRSGSSYFYSYLKLRRILGEARGVKTVLVGFSPHNIFADIERAWLFNTAHMQSRLPDYYPLMNKGDWGHLLKNNREVVKQALPSLVKGSLANIVKFVIGRKVYYGGYVQLKRDRIRQALFELENPKKPPDFTIAEVEIFYLHKIIEACRKNKVAPILVCTPKKEQLWRAHRYGASRFYAYYSNHLAHVPFLDFHDFSIPAGGFADLKHLNYSGATFFSNYIETQGLVMLQKLCGHCGESAPVCIGRL